MTNREQRIVAVCHDLDRHEELQRVLGVSGVTLRIERRFEELTPSDALHIIYVEGPPAAATPGFVAALPPTARVILLVPSIDLAGMIELLQTFDVVDGILIADRTVPPSLRRLVVRLLEGRDQSIDTMLAPNTPLQSHVLTSYGQKATCLAQLSAQTEQHRITSQLRRTIEQCCDELVMNALFAAPVDPDDRPLFATVPLRERLQLSAEEEVTVRFGCDGETFALSVRDAFGTLTRETLLRFIAKGLHSEDKVDRKIAGAGLGLFLLAHDSALVHISIVRGISTEISCAFDLKTPQQIGHFSIAVDDAPPAELATRKAARPSAPRQVSRRLHVAKVAGVAAVVAAAGVAVALMRSRSSSPEALASLAIRAPEGTTITIDGASQGRAPLTVSGLQARQPHTISAHLGPRFERRVVLVHPGTNELELTLAPEPPIIIESSPAGATVEVDGVFVGSTPSRVARSNNAKVLLRAPGYIDTTITLPSGNQPATVRAELPHDPAFGVVVVESEPPGARVEILGHATVGESSIFTPAELQLRRADTPRLLITMPAHAPVITEPLSLTSAEQLVRRVQLPDAATLRVTSSKPGTVTVVGTQHCRALELPATCPLAAGSYTIEYTELAHAPVQRPVTIGTTDVTLTF